MTGETNRRSASSGEKPEDWSLLLAAASDWASIRGLPKGSGQGSRATATIIILGRTSGVLEDIFCDCLWRLINDLTIFLTLDPNRRILFRIGEVSDPRVLAFSDFPTRPAEIVSQGDFAGYGSAEASCGA